jgi:23S rRNA pseudouridine2605 synthase
VERAVADAPPVAGAGERLHKVLARAGLGSRREIEAWIAAGRVTVNGAAAGTGQLFHAGDVIAIDDRRVPEWKLAAIERRVLAYYKPVGEVTTRHDEEGRPTVFDHLPRLRQGRWVAVGRLDLNTQGLLLFTNDGALAHGLMHPSREVEREYAVRVLGEFPPVLQQKLLDGIELDDGPARFERLSAAGGEGANQWWHVMLREGRQREVRRLFEAVGLTVSRLIRFRYGSCVLTRAHRTGHLWELKPDDVAALAELAGLPPEPPPRRPAPGRARGHERAALGASPRRVGRPGPAREQRASASDGTTRAPRPAKAARPGPASRSPHAPGSGRRTTPGSAPRRPGGPRKP